MSRSDPNILFILADEWRADTLACYGNSVVEAPRLNAFAEQATVFDQAYCTQPVCTPSRATIWTGLYPHTHGCITNNQPLSRSCPTVAEMAPERYACAYYGKWHLGDEIAAQRGWSEWVSIEDKPYRPYFSDPQLLSRVSDYHAFLVEQGFAPDEVAADGAAVFSRKFAAALSAQYTKASFLGNRASDFLTHQHEKPWFLTLSFLEPHMPFFGPYNDRYVPGELPVGPSFFRRPDNGAPRRVREKAGKFFEHGHNNYPLRTEWDWRRLRANYFGLVTLIDDAIGRVLQALEASGQADNTLVIVTSDHGEMMGDHALLTKNVELEPSVRVPLLIRAPGQKEARRVAGPVSLVDLAPTMLSFMGADISSRLQGKPLDKLLNSENASERDAVIEWHGDHPYRVLVSPDGWKLTVSPDDCTTLFNLREDPHELANRADDPSLADLIARLRARLAVWALEVGDDPAIAQWNGEVARESSR